MLSRFSDGSSASGSKKTARIFYIFIFVEMTIIIACFILLLLNQYLSTIIDDFSPAYQETYDNGNGNGKNSSELYFSMTRKSLTTEIPFRRQQMTYSTETYRPVTHRPTDVSFNDTIHLMTTPRQSNVGIENLFGKYRNFEDKNTTDNTNESSDGPEHSTTPTATVTEDDGGGGNDNPPSHKQNEVELTHLLLLYPCCWTTLILILMQIVARSMNDPMLKSTAAVLLGACVVLGVTIFGSVLHMCLKNLTPILILLMVLAASLIFAEVLHFALLLIGKVK